MAEKLTPLQTRIEAIGAVQTAYSQALAKQSTSYIPNKNATREVTAYYESVVKAWMERGQALSSAKALKGWLEAGQIHVSHFVEMGAFADSTIAGLIKQVEEIPANVKREVKQQVKAAKAAALEAVSFVGDTVKSEVGKAKIILVLLALALGGFFIWRITAK